MNVNPSKDASLATARPLRVRCELRRPLSVAQLLALPDPGYVIEEVVPAGEMILLYAEAKAGKSLVALDMALRIAAGMPWHGRTVEPGPVLYLALENTYAIKSRVQSWTQQHPTADVSGFHVLADPKCRVEDAAALSSLSECVRELQPVLVVIDTLQRFLGSLSENDHMRTAIAAVDDLRATHACAVLLVHHSGKDVSKGARGDSALEASATNVYDLRKSKSQRPVITLTCRRANNGREGWKEEWDLVPDGYGAYLRDTNAASAQPTIADMRSRVVRTVLESPGVAKGELEDHRPEAVPRDQWRGVIAAAIEAGDLRTEQVGRRLCHYATLT